MHVIQSSVAGTTTISISIRVIGGPATSNGLMASQDTSLESIEEIVAILAAFGGMDHLRGQLESFRLDTYRRLCFGCQCLDFVRHLNRGLHSLY